MLDVHGVARIETTSPLLPIHGGFVHVSAGSDNQLANSNLLFVLRMLIVVMFGERVTNDGSECPERVAVNSSVSSG